MKKKHTVPKNIMDVEFKLFGSMTVKQFTYVAITFILALLIYATFPDIPSLVTIPIIFIIVVLGLSFAFLKVNDMPFTSWFGNFLISFFSSQRKVYQKQEKQSNLLLDSPTKKQVKKIIAPSKKSSAYIRSLQNKTHLIDETEIDNDIEDILNKNKLLSLDKYFQNAAKKSLDDYNLKQADSNSIASDKKAKKNNELIGKNEDTVIIKKESNTDHRPINPNQKVNYSQFQGRTPGNIQKQIIKNKSKTNKANNGSKTNTEPKTNTEAKTNNQNQNKDYNNIQLNNKLKPNQIAGFVCDKNNKPIQRSQVLIKEKDSGNLVRSVYTDLKGKFIIPSALSNGKYAIEINAKNYNFPEFTLELEGKQIPMYKYQPKQ